MNTLYKSYRKNMLSAGGVLTPEEEAMKKEKTANLGSIISSVAGIGAGIIDSAGQGDPITGRRSVGAYTAKGALSGAAMGAQIAGPIGGAIGAGIGGIVGLVGGNKAMRLARRRLRAEANMEMKESVDRSNALLAGNTEAAFGYEDANYYAKGGNMKSPLYTMYMKGGNAKHLSSNNVEFSGKTHSTGGIKIPEMQAEVEDKETTAGSYVFSEQLGFAKLHKPIAKAIGKIESKAPTRERIGSIKRLKAREQELAGEQELLKQHLNLQ